MGTCTVTVATARIGSGVIAAATVGGVLIRGGRADDERRAVQQVLARLADPRDDDAVIGLELHLEGSTISEALGARDVPPGIPAPPG